MKRRIKILSIILTIALCFCSLFGCDKSNGNNNNNLNQDSGELKGTIKIYLPIAGDEKAVIESIMASYMAIHPKVKIEYEVGENSSYFDVCRNQLSSNDLSQVPYDIINNGQLSTFLNTNKFVDYSQYLSEENEYNDNQIWQDTLQPAAYDSKNSAGEVFALSFENTQVLFAYNKTLTDEAGLTEDDFSTWDKLVNACKVLKQKYPSKAPLALAGNKESFYGRQMAWILGVYTDQYFRQTAEIVHSTKVGDVADWNYNPRKDANWTYNPYPTITAGMTDDEISEAWNDAYNNDSAAIYTSNILRLLKAIQNDELGPINKKYQNMLANLAEVLPEYTLPNFTSLDSGNMMSKFINEDAIITLQQADYVYNSYLQRKETKTNMFEIGFFDFPAMTANQKFDELKDYGPDCNYTRSYGGSRGSYGIINKNPQQTKICIDFLKYWTSIDGQETGLITKIALGTPQLTTPLIKGVTVPSELRFGVGNIIFKGSAEQNPAVFFSRALRGETYSLTAFETNITNLFDGVITAKTLENYGTKMQNDMKSNIWRYLQMNGYATDCLDDVSANPRN